MEEAKSQTNDAAKEFNALADLITEAASNVESGNFHLNLFPKQPASQLNTGAAQSQDYDEDPNIIHIDLSNNQAKQKEDLKKIANDLGNVDLDAGA